MHIKPHTHVAVSAAALDAFETGDQQALHRALSLSPWTPSPLIVNGPYPPAWVAPGGSWAQEWRRAWQLRQKLQKAA
ncbi:MAG: hypothetical protein AAGL92_10240 [Pseudomonadota bacterium]